MRKAADDTSAEPAGAHRRRSAEQAPQTDDPVAAGPPGAHGMGAAGIQRLQAAAGNRAVSAMITRQRRVPARPATDAGGQAQATRAGEPAAPHLNDMSTEQASPAESGTLPATPVQRLAPAPRAPAASSPRFSGLKSEVKGKQKALAAHPPPATKANAAQAAAKPPADDKIAQGKAANAEKMNAAQPGAFDKAAFVRAVTAAINAQAPKTLDEADKFGESGKADAVKGQVQGQVSDGRKQSANAIETTTKAAPDTSSAREKPVTPLGPEAAVTSPRAPNPANAVPDKAPAAATDFSAGPAQVDRQMADAQVTEEQLATSNEPEFTGALKEKKSGEQHAARAPAEVRAKEAETLGTARTAAAAAGSTAMSTLVTDKKATDAQVRTEQLDTQSADEKKRAQVTGVLQKVFDTTKKDVEDILSGLDKKVDDAFGAGEKAARDAFTAEHKRRMDDYKDKRYSGFTGKLRWVKDQFAGLPEEANQIFVVSRQGYVARMQQVISAVADVVGGELTRAKQRIAAGRQQLQAEVRKLPADLRALGKQAAGEFAGRFDELTESVDAKGKELVQTLADRYNSALKEVDAEIEAEKEKNRGLIAKAVDAVKGVIDTILKLKDLLLGVLAKAAQAVMAILKDPIGFLGNLVHAVGAGLKAFLANIGTHLKKGLIGWLLGAMSGAGLQIPARFDLRGILSMVASLLGLTWAAIRSRITQKGVPEQAMSAVESGVPLVAKLQSEGVAGVTDEIKDQVGDLKGNLLGKISEYLIPTVLIAGITWIISLLNPASAFIKACKMIIDIVTFIIERGAQIIEFVNAVLDAVIAIAGGGAGGVPGLIEAALARSIPVLIGALAAILGIGGIAGKVKSLFQALSKPVMKAVDWIVAKIVKLGKAIWKRLKGGGRKKAGSGGNRDDLPDNLVPRRLAEPQPLLVKEPSEALSNEIDGATSGTTIFDRGGTPATATRQILAQHSDASYDKASGTLVLPPAAQAGNHDSLAALGSSLGARTGVSKIQLEKHGEDVELVGTINPSKGIGRIMRADNDYKLLRGAVKQSGGIIAFLKAIAQGPIAVNDEGVHGTMTLTKFRAAWHKQTNGQLAIRAWVKDQFREAAPNRHEWIPSDLIEQVTSLAATLVQEGPKLIDLQHELRSDTFSVVFNEQHGSPMVVEETIGGETVKYVVPNGHAGAVYYHATQPTRGQLLGKRTAEENTFHNELRAAFAGKSTVKEAAAAAKAVAEKWIWNGDPMTHEIHPNCLDRTRNRLDPDVQKQRFAAIIALFQRYL